MARMAKLFLLLTSALSVYGRSAGLEPRTPLAWVTQHLPIPEYPTDYVARRSVAGRFLARVDHYDAQNRNTFAMNFMSNDEHYQPGGPIFVIVGTNAPITAYFIENGLFNDLAREENAWLFTNEHRYYGTSVPVESYSVENMRFLNAEQALVDLVDWIDHLRTAVVGDPQVKVILHGIGQGGGLALWARQRFPQIVDGAWGSTAPVIAQVNFQQFGEDLGHTIRQFGGDECYSTLWRGFRTAENLIDVGLYGMVSDMFRTCQPLSAADPLSVETFLFALKDTIEAEMFATYDSLATRLMCEELTSDPTAVALEVLADFFNRRYQTLDCVPFDFETSIAAAMHEEVDHILNTNYGQRQRLYQLCTQFGWFLISSSGDSPFGTRITYQYFLAMCQTAFGDWLTQDLLYEQVRLTNIHFGADDPRTTNVLSVSGGHDPFRMIALTNYTNILSNAFVIPNAMVSMDFFSHSDADTPELRAVKNEISAYISLWIRDGLLPGGALQSVTAMDLEQDSKPNMDAGH